MVCDPCGMVYLKVFGSLNTLNFRFFNEPSSTLYVVQNLFWTLFPDTLQFTLIEILEPSISISFSEGVNTLGS